MSKQSLLLVDGDTRSLRVLEVSLRKAGFSVTPAVSVGDALDKLEVNAPDLIISETKFATEQDGFELRRRLRNSPGWADIPFIFLTAETAIENKIKGLELGVDDYLTKPIYIKEIVTRINILLQKRQRQFLDLKKDGTRFAGRVTDMPVVDVIQTIEVSRKSGVIQFSNGPSRTATIYFRDGKVIDAEAGTLQGEDAVYRLLTWNEGEFEVEFRTVRRREAITTSSQGLLMEGMRRLDEWSRLLEQLPPLSHRFEIDAGELAGRLGEIPDDNNRILRLFDSRRTLLEVIDASDFGDLECLQAISRLYFEGLLIDLDPGVRSKRDTGKSGPHLLVESPPVTPIEEVVSGPIDVAQITDRLIHGYDRPSAEHIDEDSIVGEEEIRGPLSGGYRPSSLRLIDEAVAAAQAIEPSLFEPGELEALGVGMSMPGLDPLPSTPGVAPRTLPLPKATVTPAPASGHGKPQARVEAARVAAPKVESPRQVSPNVQRPRERITPRHLEPPHDLIEQTRNTTEPPHERITPRHMDAQAEPLATSGTLRGAVHPRTVTPGNVTTPRTPTPGTVTRPRGVTPQNAEGTPATPRTVTPGVPMPARTVTPGSGVPAQARSVTGEPAKPRTMTPGGGVAQRGSGAGEPVQPRTMTPGAQRGSGAGEPAQPRTITPGAQRGSGAGEPAQPRTMTPGAQRGIGAGEPAQPRTSTPGGGVAQARTSTPGGGVAAQRGAATESTSTPGTDVPVLPRTLTPGTNVAQPRTITPGTGVAQPRTITPGTNVAQPRAITPGTGVAQPRTITPGTNVAQPRAITPGTGVAQPRTITPTNVAQPRTITPATGVAQPRTITPGTGVAQPRTITPTNVAQPRTITPAEQRGPATPLGPEAQRGPAPPRTLTPGSEPPAISRTLSPGSLDAQRAAALAAASPIAPRTLSPGTLEAQRAAALATTTTPRTLSPASLEAQRAAALGAAPTTARTPDLDADRGPAMPRTMTQGNLGDLAQPRTLTPRSMEAQREPTPPTTLDDLVDTAVPRTTTPREPAIRRITPRGVDAQHDSNEPSEQPRERTSAPRIEGEGAETQLARVALQKRVPDPRIEAARTLVEKNDRAGANGDPREQRAKTIKEQSSDDADLAAEIAAELEQSSGVPVSVGQDLGEEKPTDPSLRPFSKTRRDDSQGMRMIGSLGRDRAEASGEVRAPEMSATATAEGEPQREMVTILPRRITREIKVVVPEGEALQQEAQAETDAAKDKAVEPTPAEPAEEAKSSDAVEQPPAEPKPPSEEVTPVESRGAVESPRRAPPRRVRVAGGVVAQEARGPGRLALAFMTIAALLVGITTYTYCRKLREPKHVVAVQNDAAIAMQTPDAAPDAPEAPDIPVVIYEDAAVVVVKKRPDAAEVAVAPVDAAVAVAAIDAAVPRADAAPRPPANDAAVVATSTDAGPDKKKDAKALYDKGHLALEDGDAEKALDLLDQSLKLQKTAKTLLERARALQRLNRIDEAVASVDDAIALNKNNAQAYEQKGRILWSAQRYAEARPAFEKYLELEPEGRSAEKIRAMLDEQK